MLYLFDRLSHHPEFSQNVSLRAALLDAMYFCVMVGLGESYLSSFGIALGGTSLQIGVLASTPPLLAALAQGLGLRLYKNGYQRKSIIVVGAFLQGISWFLLSLLAFSGVHGSAWVWVLLVLWILYASSGNVTAPVWNSLIGDLVPARIRGEYFGFRNQRSGWVLVASMLLGGWILATATNNHIEMYGFGALFIIAGLSRLASSLWLSRYEDPGHKFSHDTHFTFFEFIKKLPSSNFAKFVLFWASMNAASNFSGAFFTLYVLRDLQFSYFQLSVLVTAQSLVQYYCMGNWGKLSDEFGNRRILSFCGWGVCFSGIMWLASSNFWVMLLIASYSGLVWSGFGLAGSNFLFDAVTPAKRAQCATYMSIINTFLIFMSTILAGYLVSVLPADFLVYHGLGPVPSIYFKLFVISFFLRLIILKIFLPKFNEVREVSEISSRQLLFRISQVGPMTAPVFEAIGQAIKLRKKN
jgi:MFS family permease